MIVNYFSQPLYRLKDTSFLFTEGCTVDGFIDRKAGRWKLGSQQPVEKNREVSDNVLTLERSRERGQSRLKGFWGFEHLSSPNNFWNQAKEEKIRMKIASTIVRVLMGLLFLFASITYLFKLITPPPMTGPMKVFNDGLQASVYLMPTVKVIELMCGLAFVSGKFVRLAVVVIFPIIVNIVGVHTFLDHSGLPVAIPLILADLFLAYYYRESYKPMLRP